MVYLGLRVLLHELGIAPRCSASSVFPHQREKLRAVQQTSEEIRLRLPAMPDYGSIARVAAASLAIRLEFSFREVEDLRLAVDEAMIALLGREPGDGHLTASYRLLPGALSFEAVVDFTDERKAPSKDEAERFRLLVEGLVDTYEVEPGSNRISLLKVHRTD